MDIAFFGANSRLSEQVIEALAAHHRVVAIVAGVPPASGRLTRLVRLSGQGRLARTARRLGCAYIPVRGRAEGGGPALREALARCGAEIGCVVAYPWILPEAVLRVPKRGCINMHPARLPAWRGADPVFWQVLAGENPGGITVHEVDGGMDRGAVIACCDLPLEPGVTGAAIWQRIGKLGAALMLRVLDDIEAGRAARTPQPEASPTPHALRLRGPADDLLALDARPLAEAWRLARALGWRMEVLRPRLAHAGFMLAVDRFEPGDGARGPVRLASRDGVWFLTHPGGRLVLDRRFAPLHWLRALLT